MLTRVVMSSKTRIRATLREWEDAFRVADQTLGIEGPVPTYAHVFLDGLLRPALF